MKTFPCEDFGKKSDYSGFDKESWGARNLRQHCREKAFLHKQAVLSL
jgi:hypothetical protein